MNKTALSAWQFLSFHELRLPTPAFCHDESSELTTSSASLRAAAPLCSAATKCDAVNGITGRRITSWDSVKRLIFLQIPVEVLNKCPRFQKEQQMMRNRTSFSNSLFTSTVELEMAGTGYLVAEFHCPRRGRDIRAPGQFI